MSQFKEIVCPAGEHVQGTGITPTPDVRVRPGGCKCEIEGGVLQPDEGHYVHVCTTSRYSFCPTWRAHKEKYWRDRETDVKNMRRESIERQHGSHDPVADAVLAGEAPVEAMLER